MVGYIGNIEGYMRITGRGSAMLPTADFLEILVFRPISSAMSFKSAVLVRLS